MLDQPQQPTGFERSMHLGEDHSRLFPSLAQPVMHIAEGQHPVGRFRRCDRQLGIIVEYSELHLVIDLGRIRQFLLVLSQ